MKNVDEKSSCFDRFWHFWFSMFWLWQWQRPIGQKENWHWPIRIEYEAGNFWFWAFVKSYISCHFLKLSVKDFKIMLYGNWQRLLILRIWGLSCKLENHFCSISAKDLLRSKLSKPGKCPAFTRKSSRIFRQNL